MTEQQIELRLQKAMRKWMYAKKKDRALEGEKEFAYWSMMKKKFKEARKNGTS